MAAAQLLKMMLSLILASAGLDAVNEATANAITPNSRAMENRILCFSDSLNLGVQAFVIHIWLYMFSANTHVSLVDICSML